MNSRQRRRQRRFIEEYVVAGVLAGHDGVRRVLGMPEPRGELTAIDIIKREFDALAQRCKDTEDRLVLAKEDTREAQAKLTAAQHEIRKITAGLARQSPLVAELQIAIRHIAQAASIVGADPGSSAVADVASVNELRQKVLAALKGTR